MQETHVLLQYQLNARKTCFNTVPAECKKHMFYYSTVPMQEANVLLNKCFTTSVLDLDPEVFGPPGSFSFLVKVLSGLKLCLQNLILIQFSCSKLILPNIVLKFYN
jgi:hypothetical protein